MHHGKCCNLTLGSKMAAAERAFCLQEFCRIFYAFIVAFTNFNYSDFSIMAWSLFMQRGNEIGPRINKLMCVKEAEQWTEERKLAFERQFLLYISRWVDLVSLVQDIIFVYNYVPVHDQLNRCILTTIEYFPALLSPIETDIFLPPCQLLLRSAWYCFQTVL